MSPVKNGSGTWVVPLNFNRTSYSASMTPITQTRESSFSSVITPSANGLYHVIPSTIANIPDYNAGFLTSLKNSINIGKSRVPYSGMGPRLNNVHSTNYGRIDKEDIQGKIVLRTYLEMGKTNPDGTGFFPTISGGSGSSYARVLIHSVIIKGEVEQYEWNMSTSPPTAGQWSVLSTSESASIGSQYKRNFSTNPFVFEITSSMTKVKFRMKTELSINASRDIFTEPLGNSTTVEDVTISTTANTANTSTVTSQYDHVGNTFDVALPSNFSELSGGGLQVVANSSQYVKIPRNDITSSSTNKVLETKGGIVEIDNSSGGATKALDVIGNVEIRDGNGLYVEYINSDSGDTVKYKPAEYLYKGHRTIYNTSATDAYYDVSFTSSLGTSNYYVIGTLMGSFNGTAGNSNYNDQNDCIATVFKKTTSGFRIGIRQVSLNEGSASGNDYLRFQYYVFKK
jgi:hypothetical protein